MGQMKKLWEEQRDFGALEDRVDWEELTNGAEQYKTQSIYEHKTLRPAEPTNKWARLEELKEAKDEWRLWD